MFDGCQRLSYVKALFTDMCRDYSEEQYPDNLAVGYWLEGTAQTGTLVVSYYEGWIGEYGYDVIPVGWEIEWLDPDESE